MKIRSYPRTIMIWNVYPVFSTRLRLTNHKSRQKPKVTLICNENHFEFKFVSNNVYAIRQCNVYNTNYKEI